MDFKILVLLLASTTRCVCVFISNPTSNATERHRLYTELFVNQGYNSKITPFQNQPRSFNVKIAFYLEKIIDLDEITETLKTTAFMSIAWYDTYLQWDPLEFNLLLLTYWPQDDVWKPDLVLANSVKSYESLGHETILVESFVYGEIRWFPHEVFETACDIDMTYYPYDIQTCEIKLMSWSYTAINLTAVSNNVLLTYYDASPVWEIHDTSVKHSERLGVDVLIYEIKLKRKPQHALMTLFLPVLLVNILGLFVFAIPNGGNRSGYAVTVFLAFSFYLTIVDSVMPPHSEKIPLFSIYLVVQTAQSTIITILSVLLTKAELMDKDTAVPRFLVFLVKISKVFCKKNTKSNKVHTIESIETEATSSSDNITDNNKEAKNVTETTHFTWDMVVDAVDKIAAIFFTLTLVSTSAGFFYAIFRENK
ncbi:acetylcholine receptor subunit beta-like 1 [Ruditapes philippinarum]|uniref:acetylcholine receptor subunit beta-like 1 n=1 Tax=Ruditapes philippinarum TaxID=129788 RepID=UPI00295AFAA4|nr:acetylcholine receptor subunit beta-like 1 [Ruditapes philippinarum]XP_060593582.1 acetylcholine receptor subunit beta-like 1 [Ruditapes philippinarum]